MKDVFFKFKNHFTNLATLSSFTLLAQIVAFLTLVLSSRIFLPEEIAFITLLQSVLLWTIPISCFKYDTAIVCAENLNHAKSLFGASLLAGIGFFILVTPLFWLGIYLDLYKIFSPFIWLWLFIIPLIFVFTSILQSMRAYSHYQKWYYLFSFSYFLQSISMLIFVIITYLFNLLPVHLITSYLFSTFTVVLWMVWKLNLVQIIKTLRCKKIFKEAKNYSQFSLFGLPATLLDGFTQSSVFIFIASQYGAVALASYGVVIKFAITPIQFLLSSIGLVLMRELSQKRSGKTSMGKPFFISCLMLFSFALIPGSLITIFGYEIVLLTLGPNWEFAAQMVEFLGGPMIFCACVSALSSAIAASHRIGTGALWQLLYCFFTLGLFGFAIIENLEWSSFIFLFVCKEISLYLLLLSLITITVRNPKPTT